MTDPRIRTIQARRGGPHTRGAVSLALVLAALVAAVLLSPIGSDAGGDSSDPIPTIAPSRLSQTDQRLLESGRSAPGVGEPTPEIAFITFDGTPIELHERTRPVVLVFLGSPCRECEGELSKLAVVAAISSQDAWIAALAAPAVGDDVQRAYADAGATDLLFGGIDEGGDIARSFGVKRTPATVVLNSSRQIAAVWQRSIPASVVTELVRSLVVAG